MIKVTLVPWGIKDSDNEFFSSNKYLQFKLLRDLLLLQGYQLHLPDITPIKGADMCLFFDALGYNNYTSIFEGIEAGNLANSVYFALEPPVVAKCNQAKSIRKWCRCFRKVICVQRDLDGYENISYFSDTIDKSEYDVEETKGIEKKKLLTSISGNKTSKAKGELYSERVKAYKFFGEKIPHEFEFYGVGWDSKEFLSYKGKCAKKQDTLAKYKFALSYENMDNCNGYITEKCIDVLKAKVVPIYKGARDITDFVDRECLILADDFESYDDLLNYIQNISEEDYAKKILAIENFLNSDKAKIFSAEHYAKTVCDYIVNSTKSNISDARSIFEQTRIRYGGGVSQVA